MQIAADTPQKKGISTSGSRKMKDRKRKLAKGGFVQK